MADKDAPPSDDFSVDADDFLQREDDRLGPPDDWPHDRWRDYKRWQWWYRWPSGWREDPPPVDPLGHKGGELLFVTALREVRWFTVPYLRGRGGSGLSDLFGGDMRWATRHYPAFDRNGVPLHMPDERRLTNDMIQVCGSKGEDGSTIPFRGLGTWRGPDGQPAVNTGDRILYGGQVYRPGERIGAACYIIGGKREAPAHEMTGRATYRLLPATMSECHAVLAHLDEWYWADPEARDLFAGGVWCDMLGDAPRWKPHKFVRAAAGAGKTTLLKWQSAVLGGQAHKIERTYSKARLEDLFNHTASALLLEEAEGERGTEGDRIRRVLDFVLLLSDEGASGGRFKRDVDVHGTVTMIATLTDEWRSTIRSRVTVLEMRKVSLRTDRPPASGETLEANAKRAGELSAALRARAIDRYPLFQENLALARAKLLAMGGDARDADQLGHPIAGWATFTSDQPMTEDEVARLDRFRPYIMSIADAENSADDPSDLWNTLLALPLGPWRGGDMITVGEAIIRAREPDGEDWRVALKRHGLMLTKFKNQPWREAWLAVGNKHAGLDRLFADYPNYQGIRRSQILRELRRTVRGVLCEPKPSDGPLRFKPAQTRAWLIPPDLLPSVGDDDGIVESEVPADPPAEL